MSYKRWLPNLKEYLENKTIQKCPSCGSKNVKVEDIVIGEHKSVTFFCNGCKDGVHFDGRADETIN